MGSISLNEKQLDELNTNSEHIVIGTSEIKIALPDIQENYQNNNTPAIKRISS